MSIIVQKYGGTSIGTIEKISLVADKVIAARNKGNEVVVVVSAMSGETNKLLDLAKCIDTDISGRELDVLVSTGEQITISLLTLSLIKKGHKAVSLTGSQAGIITDSSYNKARIKSINNSYIKKYLNDGNIVVVAGFQGVTVSGDITTLGRGGSDTSAVAISVALDAKECQIYTDVDGVYTTDPRISPDAKKIDKDTVIIQQLKDKTKFTTLDDVERELSSEDLMICDGKNRPMCIAGVFGGKNSGVEKNTTEIFLESAYFNPVSVRKTAKRHALSTDASFRFERSVDPNLVIYALKRAALLIEDICEGSISSYISDFYPNEIKDTDIELNFNKVNKLIGEKIDTDTITSILKSLDIKITKEDKDKLHLSVPPYRVDVTREEDVVEEILRIYGYNNIHIPTQLKSSIVYSDKLDEDHLQNVISDLLSNNGFNECMNNSLSKSSYSELITEIKLDEQVKLINPLSQDLDGMRQSLLFSGLESIAYNLNRKNHNLSFYEFGKTYQIINSKYIEKKKLILLSCGNEKSESWNEQNKKKDFFWIKQKVEHILKRLGLHNLKGKNNELSYLVDAYSFNFKKNKIADFGFVNKATLKPFGIKTDILYAELDWDLIVKHIHSKTKYSEVNKFPSVRRDLALLLDKDVEFSKLNSLAKQTETNLLKSVNLFDVYEGDKLPENKKSYALSFILEDKENTLTDSQIDGVMDKLINAFEQKLGAEVRK